MVCIVMYCWGRSVTQVKGLTKKKMKKKKKKMAKLKYHITSITSVLQDFAFADFFSISLVFDNVLHFGVGRSQIEWNMKVKGQILICTAIMLNDHSNPYIESTLIIIMSVAIHGGWQTSSLISTNLQAYRG